METRIIKTRFYQDGKVSELSYEAQNLFMYLLTCKYINISGKFELPDRLIIFEHKCTENQLKKAKVELETAKLVIFKDNWIFVVNAEKNNKYRNSPNNEKVYNNELDRIPESIKKYFNDILDGTIDTTSDSTVDTTIYSRNKYKIINKEQGIRNKKEEEEESEEKEKHKQVYQEYLDIFNEVMKKSNRILDKKTIKQLKDLKEAGYTVEDWRNACIGASKDKFITGQNDNQKNYATPEFISRPTKFEQYLQLENDRKLLREKELIAKFGRKL